MPELFARGVIVSNTRGVQATPIAEHVMAVMLALAKRLPFVLESAARPAMDAERVRRAIACRGCSTGGRSGLIGVGTIGAEIAQRATAFGMNVIAVRRRLRRRAPFRA